MLKARLLTGLASGVMACGPSANAGDLPKELAHYQSLLQRMEADSLAAYFTADGRAQAEGQPDVVGPAAIATHLKTFKDYRVLGDSMVVDSAQTAHVVGTQYGHYWQRVRVPKGDTVEVRGKFEAEWVWTKEGGWKLRRMATHR